MGSASSPKLDLWVWCYLYLLTCKVSAEITPWFNRWESTDLNQWPAVSRQEITTDVNTFTNIPCELKLKHPMVKQLTSAAMETISRSMISMNTSFVLCSYATKMRICKMLYCVRRLYLRLYVIGDNFWKYLLFYYLHASYAEQGRCCVHTVHVFGCMSVRTKKLSIRNVLL